MAELLEKESDDKSEDRAEHPVVEPQSPVDLSESLIETALTLLRAGHKSPRLRVYP